MQFYVKSQWRIQDFPDGVGVGGERQPVNWPMLPENCSFLLESVYEIKNLAYTSQVVWHSSFHPVFFNVNF